MIMYKDEGNSYISSEREACKSMVAIFLRELTN